MNVKQSTKEVTFAAVTIGIVVGVIMTAANVYLGLYAGMTVTASIPAAVIGMAVFRILLRQKNTVLQCNIVQTIASAGESLAAGVIFTIPALVLVGIWQDFKFWPTMLTALAGGILGIIFMIPLRKALIVDHKELTFPEGVACAKVLQAGNEDAPKEGVMNILYGMLLGGVFKFAAAGMTMIKGSVEWASSISGRVLYFGSDMSPALLAVGYIININVAVLMILGGLIGWTLTIPFLGTPSDMLNESAMDVAWTLWSTKIRYLGVGAMVIAGLHSIFVVRHGIADGVKSLGESYKLRDQEVDRLNQNMGLTSMGTIFILCLLVVFFLYERLIGDFGLTVLTTLAMIVMSFIFVAVASYIVGLVGSSNSPVSGMTISALLGTAALFLVFGFKGDSAILATLGVAAVVCCAACTSNDVSQDLKTGYLVGASPRSQQWVQIVGVILPAIIIPFVLTVLHTAYGIGTGLKAPQAMLFASLAQGIFGDGVLPLNFVYAGAALGVGIIIYDEYLKRAGAAFRVPLMPVAVGIYLPLSLSVPILIGGIIRYMVERKHKKLSATEEASDNGILLSSGLIAGEGIMGVVVGALLYYNIQRGEEHAINIKVEGLSDGTITAISLVAFALVVYYLNKVARKSSQK
ncbi:oligopeptide transporter, OPT family [bacterium]|nr:oligopeptide transporter, OPT family [bacterium]